MKLEGTLKQFPLSELASLMVSCTVTGVLEISGEGEVGQVFARGGRLVHARIGALRSQLALERMVELQNARFLYVGGPHSNEETLWGDPWLVIGTLMRYERLLVHVSDHIPGMDWVPALRAEGGKRGVRLPSAIWPILATIDGERSLREVITHLGYDRRDVTLAVHYLAKRGLVNMLPPRRPMLLRLSRIRQAAHAQP